MTAFIPSNNYLLSETDKQHISSFIGFYRNFYLKYEYKDFFLQKNFIFDHEVKICSQSLLSRLEHGYLAENDELYYDLLQQFNLTFSQSTSHLTRIHYLDKYLLSAFEMQNLSSVLHILKCQLQILKPHIQQVYAFEQYKIYLHLYNFFISKTFKEQNIKELYYLQNYFSDEIYLIYKFILPEQIKNREVLSLPFHQKEYQMLMDIQNMISLHHFSYGYHSINKFKTQMQLLPPLFSYHYHYYAGILSTSFSEQEADHHFRTCFTLTSILYSEQHLYFKLAENAFHHKNYHNVYTYCKKAIEFPQNLKVILPLYFHSMQMLNDSFDTIETKQLLKQSKKENTNEFFDIFQLMYELKYDDQLQFHIKNLMKQFFYYLPEQPSSEIYMQIFKFELIQHCRKFKSYKIAYDFMEYEFQFYNIK